MDHLFIEMLYEEIFKYEKHISYGLEGLFDGINIFKSAPLIKPLIEKKPSIVKEEDGSIAFHNISYITIKKRLKRIYKEKNMAMLFEVVYNQKDVEKHAAGKIMGSQRRILYFKLAPFFALEGMLMFQNLHKKYKLKLYSDIAKFIYDNTWLNSENVKITTRVNMNRLEELNDRFKLQEYQHNFIAQYPSLRDSSQLEGYILSFEQGLGKTLTSISLSLCLEKEFIVCVVPNSLKGNWVIEIMDYLKRYKNRDLAREEIYAIGESNYKPNKSKIKYLIVNHESIPKAFEFISGIPKDSMIIVDESHMFRNLNGKRVLELIELKNRMQAKDSLAMSGTPIKATPSEIVPALMLIDPTFTLEVARKYYAAFNVEGVKTMDLVQQRFKKIMFRETKAVLSLPEKILHDKTLKLPNSNRYLMSAIRDEVNKRVSEMFKLAAPMVGQYISHYKELVKQYWNGSKEELGKYMTYIDIMNGKGGSLTQAEMEYFKEYSRLNIRSRLQGQSLRDFHYAETKAIRLHSSMLMKAYGEILPKRRTELFNILWSNYTEEFVEMIRDNEKKTVIFTSLLGTAKHIYESLQRIGIGSVLVVGEVKDRTPLIVSFKEDDSIRVIVATSQTLSTGVTLTVADQMFVFGTPWRDADFRQLTDRIARIGQTTDVNIYTVMLDTPEINISTRMQEILQWSSRMFGAFVEGEAEDNINKKT